MNYTLKPIEYLDPDHSEKSVPYVPIEKDHSIKMEKYLTDILEQLKKTKCRLNPLEKKKLSEDFRNSLAKARTLCGDVEKMHDNLIERISRDRFGYAKRFRQRFENRSCT